MATKDISVIRDKKTGDIKNIRDKEIKDAKAKTAVAQTDAVRMKTVDDKEVYIDRNSLVQAIAEVMNSNSQSTIQTLFGADANGNHANINMANLASVLSVTKVIDYPSSILTLSSDGSKVVGYTDKEHTSDYPCHGGYFMSMSGFRIVFSYADTNSLHIWLNLYLSGWTGWRKILLTQ